MVDAAHCQRATDELSVILRQQQRALLSRWDFRASGKAVLQTARVVGILASIFGVTLSAVRFYADPSNWSAESTIWVIPFFVACSLLFFFQPWLTSRFWEWSFQRADRRARLNAERALRVAKRMAPFEADYDYKSGVLTYARGKDNAWQHGWRRTLKRFQARGLAVQTDSATVIFRRRTSLFPAVVILHESREWPASVVRDAGIALEDRVTPVTGVHASERCFAG